MDYFYAGFAPSPNRYLMICSGVPMFWSLRSKSGPWKGWCIEDVCNSFFRASDKAPYPNGASGDCNLHCTSPWILKWKCHEKLSELTTMTPHENVKTAIQFNRCTEFIHKCLPIDNSDSQFALPMLHSKKYAVAHSVCAWRISLIR